MSKTLDGVQTGQYTWDVAEGLPQLLQDGSTSYVTGPDRLPLEQVVGGSAYYYASDQLGSTRLLVDGSENVKNAYNFDPYGNTVASAVTVGVSQVGVRATGLESLI